IPACRHRSLTGTPASPCLRIETIWVSLNFDFFMEPPGWKDARKLYFWGVRDQGELTGTVHSSFAQDQSAGPAKSHRKTCAGHDRKGLSLKGCNPLSAIAGFFA